MAEIRDILEKAGKPASTAVRAVSSRRRSTALAGVLPVAARHDHRVEAVIRDKA